MKDNKTIISEMTLLLIPLSIPCYTCTVCHYTVCSIVMKAVFLFSVINDNNQLLYTVSKMPGINHFTLRLGNILQNN